MAKMGGEFDVATIRAHIDEVLARPDFNSYIVGNGPNGAVVVELAAGPGIAVSGDHFTIALAGEDPGPQTLGDRALALLRRLLTDAAWYGSAIELDHLDGDALRQEVAEILGEEPEYDDDAEE